MSEESDYWKEIWDKKGQQQTTDLKLLDGFEDSPLHPRDISDWIKQKLEIKKTDKVLEVGCGAGMIAYYLARDCDYVGIDYTRSLVEKHIKLIFNSVLVAEANDIPFKDKYFDKCFCYSVFHYFPDKKYAKKVVSEMMRVTKDMIFIGDVPQKSNKKFHLTYYLDDFPLGSIYDMTHCNKNRFNVLLCVR
jgi:ubiquinone/menaquinone biosynthesis C-methylase UbiE